VQEQTPHPTVEELAAFSSGKVDEEALSSIQGHIAHCPHCRAVLKTLPPDELTALLREAVKLPDPPGYDGRLPAPCNLSTAADLPVALLDHPRYRVIGRLGSGGMGTVFLAEHRLMKRLVALKVIHPKLVDCPAAVIRFQREVEAVAKLDHPNIAAAHDAEQAGTTHFLVMEFVEGQDLARMVKEQGALPVAQACEYVQQAALGLQHAHERGLVHRDIKPSNLMRTPDGKIKVLDFGLASLLSAGAAEEVRPLEHKDETPTTSGSLTDFGEGVGTPDFIAPEQIRDAHTTDPRADIYALGCTLYYVLAGQPPFPGGTSYQKVAGHLERFPVRLTAIRPDTPLPLARLIDRMMAKHAEQRCQTAKERRVEVTVTVSIPFEEFDQSEQLVGLIELFSRLVKAKDAIEVNGLVPGSTIITLEMSETDVRALISAFMIGKLDELPIEAIRLPDDFVHGTTITSEGTEKPQTGGTLKRFRPPAKPGNKGFDDLTDEIRARAIKLQQENVSRLADEDPTPPKSEP
jgi:serine/threonine protein kinase